ncbi:MAG TPA: sulfatase [Parafilimonas sp.]|nr:sulfatase [Parafilimonas sp.]
MLFLLITGMLNAFGQQVSRHPNILFAIMDDASWQHMGAYGCAWVQTPAFDYVAENGLLFKNVYTPNAKCAPSRSVILTGRYSWQLEEAANHWPYFPSEFKVFTEVLNENGYDVAFTGKGWAPGVAKNADGTPRQLLIKPYNQKRTTPPAKGISPIDYAANFKEFLDERDKQKPFFFWYGGLEPHRGYEYGSGTTKGGKSISDVQNKDIYTFWPKTDSVKEDLLDYAYEIEYFDKQLKKMLTMLRDAGELDNTIVVVTSDNGMPFPRVKGQAYEFSNHLPLAIMWPAGIKNPGRTIDDYISFIDFAPTFLNLAGLDNGTNYGMHTIAGESIATLLFNTKNPGYKKREEVLIGKERHDVGRPHDWGYPIRGIIKNGWLYLCNFKPDRWPAGNPETGYLNTDGGATKTVILNKVFSQDDAEFKYWQINFGKRPAEELYNLMQDPDCMVNLAANNKYLDKKIALKQELFDSLKTQGDPRMFGNGDVFDKYIYSDKGSVNFYERFKAGKKPNSGWVNDSDFQNLKLWIVYTCKWRIGFLRVVGKVYQVCYDL